ncbi:Uncharacterized protein PHPALM_37536 [Phytophthora palmivora]|uniref:Uncharacterized protein n=1 Tax=Phytophthora palmivora TaxID=4796 RepID=A0A2P4WX75_9STRA|nr:Uncharacterized protein PHPALM_37536 [Phytophthora palmivora]
MQIKINGNWYDFGYYLADGIYPCWATLIQTISVPKDQRERNFASNQEAARKDVERALVYCSQGFLSSLDLHDFGRKKTLLLS